MATASQEEKCTCQDSGGKWKLWLYELRFFFCEFSSGESIPQVLLAILKLSWSQLTRGKTAGKETREVDWGRVAKVIARVQRENRGLC